MIVIVGLGVFGADGAGARDRLPGPIPAALVRVIDGDSFIVKARTWIDQETTVTVRPRGYDSAELRGRCDRERMLALRAKRDLSRILTGAATILLSDIEADKYGGRVNARVILQPGSQDLTARMLDAAGRSGHSRPYKGRREAWCITP
ncbi:MAG: thermonuclease family protein [Alphaproteobacteria bacterium]